MSRVELMILILAILLFQYRKPVECGYGNHETLERIIEIEELIRVEQDLNRVTAAEIAKIKNRIKKIENLP